MFIQSFILCIIAIFVIFYKKNDNISFYKKINDSNHKVILLSNIINCRNSLLNYCNFENLTDLIYEIENNDLIYYNQLLKIKNKIDIYYKLNTNTNIDSNSNSNTDIDSNSNSNTDIDSYSDIDSDTDTKIKDINTDIKDINTDIKDIKNIKDITPFLI
jgi:dsDNA-specific endonuclease/ATPase MutS2